jgi:hypothetical protein
MINSLKRFGKFVSLWLISFFKTNQMANIVLQNKSKDFDFSFKVSSVKNRLRDCRYLNVPVEGGVGGFDF